MQKTKKKSMKRNAVRRRESAASLLIERRKRTAAEQLKLLDTRLGASVGAAKERSRLLKELESK